MLCSRCQLGTVSRPRQLSHLAGHRRSKQSIAVSNSRVNSRDVTMAAINGAAAATLVSSGSAALQSLEDYRIAGNLDMAQVPDALKKDCILFYTPDTEALAHKIAATSDSKVQLGKIRWRSVLQAA